MRKYKDFRDIVKISAMIGNLEIVDLKQEQTRWGPRWYAYCKQKDGTVKRFHASNLI